ncbi:histidine kinase [Isoptericola sp. b515]|uniref:sensor histidine kinase n=1 Tax=Isoptericola sp. b515 TaxID=3064652 RepID=UPI002712B6F7|nr:histidine kinase [Isoptericola sp. b515]MDO8147798.1 histidine kinase [Isoptericola sp. b515]
MDGRPQHTAARGLLVGLDVLLVVLTVVTVVRAPAGQRAATAVVALVLLGLYAAGRRVVRVYDRPVDAPRGRWWPDAAWVTALTVVWAVLLVLSPEALWTAFPLLLLQMHVLGPRRGLPAVAVTTVVAVGAGLARAEGPWLGFVLGPVLGAAVAAGVVLGLEAIVRESQARQRALDELTRARRHLARAERESAVAAERERLARDIHDTLAQSLSAIELLLRTADEAIGTDDARARALVARSREAAASSLAEARRFVRDLTPVDLDGGTLLAALRRVAERSTATADEAAGHAGALTVTVESSGTPRPLPLAVETALLRVAQSALANVVRHARATQAGVVLRFTDDTVVLDVVDDGCGFDPGATDGFGLAAMRSRAAELGGTLVVDSTPGSGTALAVAVPLAEEAAP